ncbi:MAG: transglycosylase SLT domain-containing protein [Myxococcales bacterium]
MRLQAPLLLVSALLVCGIAARADVPDPSQDNLEEELVRGPAFGDAELAPYFAAGPLKQAAAEVEAGRGAQALKLIPAKPQTVPAKWLRAFALRASGQSAQAKRAFEELALLGGPLADRAVHLAGLCAVDLKDGAAAERLLGQVSARYVDADQAMLERARQVMKLRVPGAATAAAVEEIVHPILAGDLRGDVAAAHLTAGDAQLAAGDKDAARAHYRSAWVDRPLSAAAESARQREARLGPGEPIATGRLIRRAEVLLEAHRNREALDQISKLNLPSLCAGGCPGDQTPAALLQAALALFAPAGMPVQHEPTPEDIARIPPDPSDGLACRAKLVQGRALRKEREYLKSKSVLAPVVLRCADPDVRARALYLLAQIDTILSLPEAAPLWEALHRNFPQSTLADDAVFSQATVRRRGGDFAGERALLEDIVDHHLDSDLRSEALFRLFWSHFAEGNARKGLIYLDQLAAHPDPDGAEEERARYWRARALVEADPTDTEAGRAAAREAARADLVWLVEGRPLTYHGLLARGRLSELDPARLRSIDEAETKEVASALHAHGPLHAGPMARDPHFLAAVELIRLGRKQEASRELLAVERAPLRSSPGAGEEALILLADLSARAGDLRNAHAIVRIELRGLLRRTSEPLALRAAGLAYPLAFRDQIAKTSKTAAIPPDLLQALMREESALDPRALSPTGALGLTQVMPATARDVARKLKLHGFSPSKLYEPDVSIRIGGTYLGELYARFQHPALAYASYNAGPGAVSSWLSKRGTLPLDVFVEEIPLDETRGYVKRCLRSFAAYQYLYGDGKARGPQVLQQLAGPKQESRRFKLARSSRS